MVRRLMVKLLWGVDFRQRRVVLVVLGGIVDEELYHSRR